MNKNSLSDLSTLLSATEAFWKLVFIREVGFSQSQFNVPLHVKTVHYCWCWIWNAFLYGFAKCHWLKCSDCPAQKHSASQTDKIRYAMSSFVPPGFDFTALAGSLFMSIEMQYLLQKMLKKNWEVSAWGIYSDYINFMKNPFCPSKSIQKVRDWGLFHSCVFTEANQWLRSQHWHFLLPLFRLRKSSIQSDERVQSETYNCRVLQSVLQLFYLNMTWEKVNS